MQNARNYTIHILYPFTFTHTHTHTFYIDWVVRTGIRIELFMFVGVVVRLFSHMCV